MKALLILALLLGAHAPSVSARAYCAGEVFRDIAIDASYTAGAHDEYVTVVATANGARTVLGRDVFVRRHTTFETTADTGQHSAPDGVHVRWSGFSSERSLPWSIRWRTPSIECSHG